MELVHDYFYQVEHKRLREAYKWETILRHESQIMAALHSRHEAQLRLHLTAATPRKTGDNPNNKVARKSRHPVKQVRSTAPC